MVHADGGWQITQGEDLSRPRERCLSDGLGVTNVCVRNGSAFFRSQLIGALDDGATNGVFHGAYMGIDRVEREGFCVVLRCYFGLTEGRDAKNCSDHDDARNEETWEWTTQATFAMTVTVVHDSD